jgi:hypothetical protein
MQMEAFLDYGIVIFAYLARCYSHDELVNYVFIMTRKSARALHRKKQKL